MMISPIVEVTYHKDSDQTLYWIEIFIIGLPKQTVPTYVFSYYMKEYKLQPSVLYVAVMSALNIVFSLYEDHIDERMVKMVKYKINNDEWYPKPNNYDIEKDVKEFLEAIEND